MPKPRETRRQINTHILATDDAIDATLAHVAERAAPVRPDPKREGPRVVRLRVAKPRDEAIRGHARQHEPPLHEERPLARQVLAVISDRIRPKELGLGAHNDSLSSR